MVTLNSTGMSMGVQTWCSVLHTVSLDINFGIVDRRFQNQFPIEDFNQGDNMIRTVTKKHSYHI